MDIALVGLDVDQCDEAGNTVAGDGDDNADRDPFLGTHRCPRETSKVSSNDTYKFGLQTFTKLKQGFKTEISRLHTRNFWRSTKIYTRFFLNY